MENENQIVRKNCPPQKYLTSDCFDAPTPFPHLQCWESVVRRGRIKKQEECTWATLSLGDGGEGSLNQESEVSTFEGWQAKHQKRDSHHKRVASTCRVPFTYAHIKREAKDIFAKTPIGTFNDTPYRHRALRRRVSWAEYELGEGTCNHHMH
jgi:hypothetical protein